MSNSPNTRSSRTFGTGSPRSDLSTGDSTPPTDGESSRFHVTLQPLDDELLTITARLRYGARTRSVERAVRKYLASAIQESDAIRIYRAGKTLRADDRLSDDTQLLHYCVFPSANAVALPIEAPGDQDVGEPPNPTCPIPRSFFRECMTVAHIRDACARMIETEDPRNIIVSLVGGLRAGNLEGNSWKFDKIARWQSRDAVFSVCRRDCYLVVCGYGKEYLFQESRDTGDGVSARDIKRWLKDRVIRQVHPTLETRNPVTLEDIDLLMGERLVPKHTPLIPWKKVLQFRLSPHVEEAFFEEEEWLDSSFECSVCKERSLNRAPRLSEGCTHERTVCTPCVRKWVSTHLTEDGWDKARCPLCCHPLTYHEIKPYVTKKVFARYFLLSGVGGRVRTANPCPGTRCSRQRPRWGEFLTSTGVSRKAVDQARFTSQMKGIQRAQIPFSSAKNAAGANVLGML